MRRDHRSVSRSRRSRGTWRVTTSNPVAPYAGTALEALTRRRNRRFGRSRGEASDPHSVLGGPEGRPAHVRGRGSSRGRPALGVVPLPGASLIYERAAARRH
jgi:hypothetical protein